MASQSPRERTMTATDPGQRHEELVPVHVPRSLLGEVYRLIADRTPGQLHAEPADDHPAAGEWTVEDFQTLLADGRPAAYNSGRLLDVLAERPDTAVGLAELAAEAGLQLGEAKGALAGLTQICHEIWPDHGTNGIWPMRKVWRRVDRPGQQGEIHYIMTARYARRWLRARDRG